MSKSTATLQVHLVPVLLDDGVRLLAGLGTDQRELKSRLAKP